MTPSISSLRRRAAKLGYHFRKSIWRKDSPDNLGGYQVVDISRNTVVHGSSFECSVDDVAAFLEREEAA